MIMNWISAKKFANGSRSDAFPSLGTGNIHFDADPVSAALSKAGRPGTFTEFAARYSQPGSWCHIPPCPFVSASSRGSSSKKRLTSSSWTNVSFCGGIGGWQVRWETHKSPRPETLHIYASETEEGDFFEYLEAGRVEGEPAPTACVFVGLRGFG